MSTYNLPGKHQVSEDITAFGSIGRQAGNHGSPYLVLLGLAAPEARCKEAHLSNSVLRSARFTAPIVLALGALNAWTAQHRDDNGAVATQLRLCVCAVGLLARTSCNVATAGIERSSRS